MEAVPFLLLLLLRYPFRFDRYYSELCFLPVQVARVLREVLVQLEHQKLEQGLILRKPFQLWALTDHS